MMQLLGSGDLHPLASLMITPGDAGAGHIAISRHSLVGMSLGGCAQLYRTLASFPASPNVLAGYNGDYHPILLSLAYRPSS